MRVTRSWGVCQEFWFITNPGYFQSLNLAKSCSNLKKIRPRAESGSYVIDPDGEGGLLPMYDVICDMTDKNGVGVALISHDSENRTLVKGYEAPGSYSPDIHYRGASLPYQIQHCFECIWKLFLKTVFNLFCEIGFK